MTLNLYVRRWCCNPENFYRFIHANDYIPIYTHVHHLHCNVRTILGIKFCVLWWKPRCYSTMGEFDNSLFVWQWEFLLKRWNTYRGRGWLAVGPLTNSPFSVVFCSRKKSIKLFNSPVIAGLPYQMKSCSIPVLKTDKISTTNPCQLDFLSGNKMIGNSIRIWYKICSLRSKTYWK